MKVLLVEGAPGVGAAAEEELTAAGHQVVGCEAADPSAPCRGLESGGSCPLDDGDIDVAVVSRATSELQPSERGALCAARNRVPVVLVGNPRQAVSFGPGTHVAGRDLLGTVTTAARSGTAHESAIRRELLMAGVIQTADVDEQRVTFAVQREPRRLRLVVGTVRDEPRADAIRKAAGEALRRFDRAVSIIDVATDEI